MMATTHDRKAVLSLPTDTQILITRQFDAPKALLWRAFTSPELIKRWWAGDRGVVTIAEVDLRVGGAWRYVLTANGGFEVAFHGEYREIVPPERTVYTEVFEGMPDASSLNTMTLLEREGRTTLSVLVEHQSRQNRDQHLNSGMEGGLNEALDHLEQVARSLR